ncbi:MAG TPA: hypothetical protein VJ376_16730 [Pseudomonadota bacterium]|nr:hypothetical protein [Pseudomonadota bacterium]
MNDNAGRKLAYVYFENQPGRSAAKLLIKDGCAADRGEHRQAAGVA